MSNIYNYDDFLNEEFFKKVFGKNKNKKKQPSSKIDNCVDSIINFLYENGIDNWDDFIKSGKFDKEVINRLIDHSAKNMEELKEIRFKIRLELSNINQLREYLKELEENEEYEKCAQVIKKISNK
jgi:protein-arginine kinase activator protein McsA